MEHANRGKRSVGLNLADRRGHALLCEMAARSDVFLTNFLPSSRAKLGIEVADLRAANPKIIYARGSAYGDKGAERDQPGYDVTAFWARGGIGHTISPPELDTALMQGIAAFGDSISGMNLAGGIAAALFGRDRTGEPSEVDVSLMSSAGWAAGSGLAIGL
jgi:crotonobetainyl-CoA:carnitine CoA-transferase CaiB-like acyl-CoA transferase